MNFIHPSAIISEKAKLGKNIKIGQFTTIYDNVLIGDNTTIEGYCEIGVSSKSNTCGKLIIGKDSYIRSFSIFYEGSKFKDKLITGHRVLVREKTIAGENLQIGSFSDIEGDCEIGNYVRIHSSVHISQKTKIGNFVWIFPNVIFTNDPHPPSNNWQGVTVEDFSVICTGSIILPGINIKKGSVIAAGTVLNQNTEENTLYAGNPSKRICHTSKILNYNGKKAYPWIKHFHRGYPEKVLTEWKKILEKKDD